MDVDVDVDVDVYVYVWVCDFQGMMRAGDCEEMKAK